MDNTKEKILREALDQFSQRGFDAVSVSDISRGLGLTKSALYKHFPDKRGIFEGIIKRMEAMDRAAAEETGVPADSRELSPESYEIAQIENLKAFALDRFDYWTCDEWGRKFRRMLTLEQYTSDEMGKLYDAYLGAGPLEYVQDILKDREKALEFYGGVYLLISVWDRAKDRNAVRERAKEYIEQFGG